MSKEQIDILADWIMSNIKGEPSESEGAGDTAIRIIKRLQAENKVLKDALNHVDNNAFAIRLAIEQTLQGKKGSE